MDYVGDVHHNTQEEHDRLGLAVAKMLQTSSQEQADQFEPPPYQIVASDDGDIAPLIRRLSEAGHLQAIIRVINESHSEPSEKAE